MIRRRGAARARKLGALFVLPAQPRAPNENVDSPRTLYKTQFPIKRKGPRARGGPPAARVNSESGRASLISPSPFRRDKAITDSSAPEPPLKYSADDCPRGSVRARARPFPRKLRGQVSAEGRVLGGKGRGGDVEKIWLVVEPVVLMVQVC